MRMGMKALGIVALAIVATGCSELGMGESGSTGQTAGTSRSTVSTYGVNAQGLTLGQDAIKHIQTVLQQQGLYNGPVDGVVGPETVSALKAYQSKQGLQQTAALDQETLTRLFANNPSESGAADASRSLMSPDQIRDRLQANGYSNIRDVRQDGERAYTAMGDRAGKTYTVQVDGQTGQVLSTQ